MNCRVCDKCNDNIGVMGFARHYKVCNGIKKDIRNSNIELFSDKIEKLNENLFKCLICSKEFNKYGIKSHVTKMHISKIKCVGWNKGLTKETDSRLKQQSETLSNRYKSGELVHSPIVNKSNFKHSEEHKKRLSDWMKKKTLEGTNPGWVSKNSDPNRRSYPEKYFEEVLKNNDLYNKYNIQHNFRYGKYFLDFAFIDIKLDLEIDGEQHLSEDSIEHDNIRNEYLSNETWKIYRIPWNEFNRLSKEGKQLEIDKLLNYISNIKNESNHLYTIDDLPYFKAKLEQKQRREVKILENLKLIEDRKQLILHSGVDFSKFGWVTQLEKQLSYPNVGRFIRKNMKEFYNTCFKPMRE